MRMDIKFEMENPAVRIMKLFVRYYNERDLEKMMGLYSQRQKVHCWGTGLDEDRRTWDEIKVQVQRDWQQSDRAVLFLPEVVYSSDDVKCAWASADCRAEVTVNQVTTRVPHLRCSLYVSREDGQWKIAHMHISFPADAQPVGSSFPATGVS